MELVHVLVEKVHAQPNRSGLLVHLLRLVLHPAPGRGREALDNDSILLNILAARGRERQRCGCKCQEHRGCMQETHVGSFCCVLVERREGGQEKEKAWFFDQHLGISIYK